MVDCVRFNKKLVPVGEFLPGKTDVARFAIEGLETGAKEEYPEVYVDEECTCYCQTCNKFAKLNSGDRIPPCCGKLMEILD
jgi:Zn finger protein HypA/HybF involved in hydrogenase expression